MTDLFEPKWNESFDFTRRVPDASCAVLQLDLYSGPTGAAVHEGEARLGFEGCALPKSAQIDKMVPHAKLKKAPKQLAKGQSHKLDLVPSTVNLRYSEIAGTMLAKSVEVRAF